MKKIRSPAPHQQENSIFMAIVDTVIAAALFYGSYRLLIGIKENHWDTLKFYLPMWSAGMILARICEGQLNLDPNPGKYWRDDPTDLSGYKGALIYNHTLFIGIVLFAPNWVLRTFRKWQKIVLSARRRVI